MRARGRHLNFAEGCHLYIAATCVLADKGALWNAKCGSAPEWRRFTSGVAIGRADAAFESYGTRGRTAGARALLHLVLAAAHAREGLGDFRGFHPHRGGRIVGRNHRSFLSTQEGPWLGRALGLEPPARGRFFAFAAGSEGRRSQSQASVPDPNLGMYH